MEKHKVILTLPTDYGGEHEDSIKSLIEKQVERYIYMGAGQIESVESKVEQLTVILSNTLTILAGKGLLNEKDLSAILDKKVLKIEIKSKN